MRRLGLVFGILITLTAIPIAYSVKGIPQRAPISDTASLPIGASQQMSVEVQYIANEGVLISAGDKQVLIDGLHRKEGAFSHYAALPAAERDKLETAQAPFDKIDLLLVSHRHYDHFHSESVGLYLRHNPNAVLLSSEQVVGEVAKKFKDYEAIKARVIGATPPLKERVAMKVAGIDLEILGLGHGSTSFREIQNLGHLIKLGGKKLLHVGDVETEAGIFERFNLDEEGIDIAILPFWLLLDQAGQTIVREHIKPKHIIAVHMETLKAAKLTTQIKQAFPEAVIFTTLLEKRRYSAP
jgi:L-ascorbate metabolism protein UlaG (beta-lactamase superfamily)